MGLLDDAIREHLDLKRRHGADPNEMEKLEREALGPVRRGADAPQDEPPQPAEDDALYEDAAPGWSEPDLAEESLVAEPELSTSEVPEAPEAHEAPEGPPGGSVLFDHEADGAPPPARAAPLAEDEHPTAENPAPAAAGPPPPTPEPAAPEPNVEPLDGDHLNEETAEYDVEAEHAREQRPPEDRAAGEAHAASGAKEDDVLEETPEFLQDTPDHDRLWFEQRPPRDFDFDDK